MRLIDLTRTLDPTDVERMPEVVRPLAAVLAPKIQYLAPGAEGRDRMCAIFGCTPDDLPGREGWGEEMVTMNSHSGTHVDAPLHYGSTCEGQRARTIPEIRLEELYCDGMVLDLRGKCEQGRGITLEALAEAIDAFTAYLRSYRGAARAGAAQFAIAENFEHLGKWVSAMDSYNNYVNNYPDGPLVAKAKEQITWIKTYRL